MAHKEVAGFTFGICSLGLNLKGRSRLYTGKGKVGRVLSVIVELHRTSRKGRMGVVLNFEGTFARTLLNI